MAYHETFNYSTHISNRDTRIDVVRSLALLTIFINHIPGTVYEHITHKNFGFSDATEIFVLLSGVSLGLSFHARLHKEHFHFFVYKLWHRAFQLYKAHIFATFTTLGLFLGAFFFWNAEKLLLMNNINLFTTQPVTTFFSTLGLGHQLGYNNILPLYIVLMIFSPFALYLSRKHKVSLLFISFIIYLICGFYRIAPPSYPLQGQWFLNPLSWQFLFVIGLTGTLCLKQGKTIAFQPCLFFLSASYLVLSLLWVRLNWWGIIGWLNLSSPLINFNKTFLSLPRLLHILSLSFVVLSLPWLHERLRVSQKHPLAILGKHSLPVFVTGTIFSMFGQIFKTLVHSTFFSDTLLITGGIAIQFLVAYYHENQRSYRQSTHRLLSTEHQRGS